MYAQVTDVLPFIEGYMVKYETKRKSLIQDMEIMALQSPSKKRKIVEEDIKRNQNVEKLKRNQNVLEERNINYSLFFHK